MKPKPLLPVILCGGTGTRLWPLSRASYPKQYWALEGTDKNTLLQKTQKRLKGINNLIPPLLVCHEDHRFIVAEQMRQINIQPHSILLEPIGRNTAPAITLAALKATENGQDPLLLILSADHIIKDEVNFRSAVEAGRLEAEKGKLVTFGIIPTAPETGYGYIEAKGKLERTKLTAVTIDRFIEKPNKSNALKFIADDRYSWNSGIFLFKASTILNEIERFEPEIINYCRRSLEKDCQDLDFLRVEKESFSKCPNIAIDVAVMEKTSLGTVLPLNAGWSDIGSWNALWENTPQDINGNVLLGKTIAEETQNCYLRSEHRIVVGLGIKDLIVVETDDAVLIAERNHAQKVKNIVGKLESFGHPEGKAHRKIYRPWGHYTGIVEGSRWQVKRIEVKPGESLSLQLHHHRAEHWIVVKGTALVEKNGEKILLGENQSTYIPLGCKHRLSNPGKMPMELIEVQSGGYLGEDDIIRFEDNYFRNKIINKGQE